MPRAFANAKHQTNSQKRKGPDKVCSELDGKTGCNGFSSLRSTTRGMGCNRKGRDAKIISLHQDATSAKAAARGREARHLSSRGVI